MKSMIEHTILTICIDPERGKYMAVSCQNPQDYRVVSHTSVDDAVGMLVKAVPGICIKEIINL
jgi:hypothetical protein